jgi:LPS sulfotransferase NodH
MASRRGSDPTFCEGRASPSGGALFLERREYMSISAKTALARPDLPIQKPGVSQASSARRGYVICAEPRSGSNLLCQALASTGRLGRPLDYFHAAGLRAKGWSDYPAAPERQLDMLLAHGVTPNGVYGFKLFSVRFDAISGLGWAERLPALHFVHLGRLDLLGQAISDLRSAQTGQYRAGAPPAAPPRYDRRAIARRLAMLARGEARWRAYFARNGIAPLQLRYEEVAANPQAAVEAVAALVGVAEPVRIDPARIEVRVQRDALSDDWRARFLAEARELDRLDSLNRRARDVVRRLVRA